LVINILLGNSYSLDLIFFTIKRRLTKFQIFNNYNGESFNYLAVNKKDLYFIISYIANVITKFIHFFKNISNIKFVFIGINKPK